MTHTDFENAALSASNHVRRPNACIDDAEDGIADPHMDIEMLDFEAEALAMELRVGDIELEIDGERLEEELDFEDRAVWEVSKPIWDLAVDGYEWDEGDWGG
jgi:hypothetical protein